MAKHVEIMHFQEFKASGKKGLNVMGKGLDVKEKGLDVRGKVWGIGEKV